MGWWIQKDGHSWPNPDHWEFLRSHAKLFGYKKSDAAKLTLENRESVLEGVLYLGWIRVRGHAPHRSFSFAVLDNATMFNIREFLTSTKADPHEQILFEEVATGASWYKPASWLLSDEALVYVRNPRKPPARRPKGR